MKYTLALILSLGGLFYSVQSVSAGDIVVVREARAITEFGDAIRAMGRFYEGYGAGARSYAEALFILEQAKTLALANRERRILMKQQERDLYNRRLREQLAAHRGTPEQLRALAVPEGADLRVRRTDGTIDWPVVLREAQFASQRVALEALLRGSNAENTESTLAGLRPQIRDACNGWLVELRAQIADYHPADYIEARRFLVAIRNQSLRPAQSQGQ